MKIACIIHSLSGGGAERVMAALASHLARRGHQITLITFDDAREDRHSIDPSVVRMPLGVMQGGQHGIRKMLQIHHRHKAIRRAVKQSGPDVVLSFCDRTNIDVLLSTIGLRLPVVISERSDPAKQSLGRFWENVRRRAYPLAARVVVLTESIAETLKPLSRSPVAIIPSGIERVTAPKLDNQNPGHLANKIVLGVGRLEYEKGFDRLIMAFAKIAIEVPDWSLKILGEGTQRSELTALASEHGIAQRVTMPGWVRPIYCEYDNATIFVLPSRYEGFPSALLEAMAAGLPSIAMHCQSGSAEIIQSQYNGLLIDDNVDALAEGILNLIKDEPKRMRFSASAKEVVEKFSFDKMVDAYEELLQSVRRGDSAVPLR